MASRWSAYRPCEPAAIELRRAVRHPVQITRATISTDGEPPVSATLKDLSTYGCRVSSPEGHAPGERVSLRLSGGSPIDATVIWAAGGLAGYRFDAPIGRETVRALTLGLVAV